MVFNTFSSGVNTSFSSQLNTNFQQVDKYLFDDSTVYTTTASSSTLLTSVNIDNSMPKNGIKVTAELSGLTASATGNYTCTFWFVVAGTVRRVVTIQSQNVSTGTEYVNKTAIIIDRTTDFSSDRTLAIYGARSASGVTARLENYIVEAI